MKFVAKVCWVCFKNLLLLEPVLEMLWMCLTGVLFETLCVLKMCAVCLCVPFYALGCFLNMIYEFTKCEAFEQVIE